MTMRGWRWQWRWWWQCQQPRKSAVCVSALRWTDRNIEMCLLSEVTGSKWESYGPRKEDPRRGAPNPLVSSMGGFPLSAARWFCSPYDVGASRFVSSHHPQASSGSKEASQLLPWINSLDWTVGHGYLPGGGALTAGEWHRGSFRFQEVFKTKELNPKPLLPWPLFLRNNPGLHLQATSGSIFILAMCSLGQLCFYLLLNFVLVSFF